MSDITLDRSRRHASVRKGQKCERRATTPRRIKRSEGKQCHEPTSAADADHRLKHTEGKQGSNRYCQVHQRKQRMCRAM